MWRVLSVCKGNLCKVNLISPLPLLMKCGKGLCPRESVLPTPFKDIVEWFRRGRGPDGGCHSGFYLPRHLPRHLPRQQPCAHGTYFQAFGSCRLSSPPHLVPLLLPGPYTFWPLLRDVPAPLLQTSLCIARLQALGVMEWIHCLCYQSCKSKLLHIEFTWNKPFGLE